MEREVEGALQERNKAPAKGRYLLVGIISHEFRIPRCGHWRREGLPNSRNSPFAKGLNRNSLEKDILSDAHIDHSPTASALRRRRFLPDKQPSPRDHHRSSRSGGFWLRRAWEVALTPQLMLYARKTFTSRLRE
jgi:hypothetical protein